MVFIRFRDPISSEEFAEAYNGKAFNSLEVSRSLTLIFTHLFIRMFSPRYATSSAFCP